MSADILVYRGDDFDGWNADNNPNRQPVVQLQSPSDSADPFRLGGWVLQRPNPNSPYNWVAVPLQAQSEREGLIEARGHLA